MSVIRPIGPCPAKVMIVGEFPSESEEKFGEAFNSYAGNEFMRMLREVRITPSTCFMTLALQHRPIAGKLKSIISNKVKPPTPTYVRYNRMWVVPSVVEDAKLLASQISLCNPDIIIALGDAALFLLTGNWSITKWRGSELVCSLSHGLGRDVRVVPTYHPGMFYKNWELRAIAIHDLRRCVGFIGKPIITPRNNNFIIAPSYSTAKDYLLALSGKVMKEPYKLSVDIETRAYHMACLAIAWTKHDAICIPWMHLPSGEHYFSLEEEANLQYLLYFLLTHANARVVGQNFHYDAQYFYRYNGYIPRLARDTMVTHHTLFLCLKKSLDFQASMYCEQYTYWKDDGKEYNANWDEMMFWRYNCEDAARTYEIDDVQQGLVDTMHMRAQHDFQQELWWPILQTMNYGVRVDEKRKGTLALELLEAINKAQAELNYILGYEINIRSSQQMQTLFYDDFGFKPVIDKKTKSISCAEPALETLVERELLVKPIVDRILDLRSLGVFLGTFINAPLDIDHRLRCSFNECGTETLRFSSSKNAFGSGLNLQNIPKGGHLRNASTNLPNVRELFIPDPGMEFFDIDLKSADLRIVVWEADEPSMKQMLREGYDPYTEIAKEFYHDKTITKADPRRKTFKSLAHGTHYLGKPEGLSKRLGLPAAEIARVQKWYFEYAPNIKKYQERIIDQVKSRHFVENIFGYRYYFLGKIEGTIFNQAAAWVPQSTVALIINTAYRNIARNLPLVQVLLQVHDSLAGQYPIAKAQECKAAIIEQAQTTLPYPGDPMIVPVDVATSRTSWGACK